MTSFLIEYTKSNGDLKISDFANKEDAVVARIERMRACLDEDIEIVSVTAESLSALRRSHSRYFAREQIS